MIFKNLDRSFWNYGHGAMSWRIKAGGYPFLLVIFTKSNGFIENRMIYPFMSGKDWSKPGDICGWNGQIRYPSFYPSIYTGPNDVWYIIEGHPWRVDYCKFDRESFENTINSKGPSTPEELSEELKRLWN